MGTVTFKRFEYRIADILLSNLKEAKKQGYLMVEGNKYILLFESKNKNRTYRSRGFSYYFRLKNSIIRISDHWSSSNFNDRSKKLNCGYISHDQYWIIDNKIKSFPFRFSGEKYDSYLLAGIVGLAKLRKSCKHF